MAVNHPNQRWACDLTAIAARNRPRYQDLVGRLRGGMVKRSETPEGYAFEIDEQSIDLTEIAEWMAMERLCCPFLTLQLSASGDRGNWLLTFSGPNGVKPLLQAEFPWPAA